MKINKWDLMASITRESFYEFLKFFWDTIYQEKPVWNWHIEYLCNELQTIAERVIAGRPKLYDLIINISPGTTKSTIASVMFPVWVWTRMPSARSLCGSYSDKLALNLSRYSRDIVESEKYKKCFGLELRSDQNTKGLFMNKNGGYRYAVGVNGTVTGFHGHFLICDDPINPEQALSELELATANNWLSESFANRKVDKSTATLILIMQRLHQYDPSAMFLERKNVKHICLPAEATEKISPPELRDRYIDGLMDPIRLSRKILEEEESRGQYYYGGQFLQDPVPRGGGMFRTGNIRIQATAPEKFKHVIRYWDKAGTAHGGAYTVGVKMGLDMEGRIWVLDVIRVQLDSYERERLIKMTARFDGYNVTVGLEQEPGSSGKESAYNTVKNLIGFRLKIDKVGPSDGNKVNRADAYSSQVNGGNVYLLNAPWNKEYLDELTHFPLSKYKDQVDASSGGFNYLYKGRLRVGGSATIRDKKQLEVINRE